MAESATKSAIATQRLTPAECVPQSLRRASASTARTKDRAPATPEGQLFFPICGVICARTTTTAQPDVGIVGAQYADLVLSFAPLRKLRRPQTGEETPVDLKQLSGIIVTTLCPGALPHVEVG
jgi:hypothetical protein